MATKDKRVSLKYKSQQHIIIMKNTYYLKVMEIGY